MSENKMPEWLEKKLKELNDDYDEDSMHPSDAYHQGYEHGFRKAYELLSPYLMVWKPIEGAPKDGRVFIGAVFKDGHIYQLDACNLFPHFRPPYTVVDKEFGGDIVLTHCCELPKPPKEIE